MNTERYSVCFHGHSHFSDGKHPITRLVQTAITYGIDFFGTSEHDSVKGMVALHQLVCDMEESGNPVPFVPVYAAELTTRDGDVVVALPGVWRDDFATWLSDIPAYDRSLASVISESYEKFSDSGVIHLIVHPGIPFIASVSLDLLRQLPNELGDNIFLSVGVEVYNASSSVIPFNSMREKKIGTLATECNYATFGQPDFHFDWQIPHRVSHFTSHSEKSGDSLATAVRERRVKPSDPTPLSFPQFVILSSHIGVEFLKSKLV